MTATMTEVLHEPWCTAHVDAGPEVGPEGWCAHEAEVHGTRIGIVIAEGGRAEVEIYAPGDVWQTPAQVREVASAILAAADLVEASRNA